jgi:dihydropteroate synthase
VEYALQLLQDGADIVDVGGESTRPGAHVAEKAGATVSEKAISEKEELRRVIPVIAGIKQKNPKATISVDTYKAGVARKAAEAGAEIVNDVSGFLWDPNMTKTLAELKCGAIVMHMRGLPKEWRTLPPVTDIVSLVKRELRDRTEAAVLGGMKRERMVIDPGFGFGKNREENYPLLRRFEEFHQLRFPLLAGVSRKSFIGRALARDGKDAAVADRQFGTLAAETVLILRGAQIIRTHDVRACVDAARMADLAAG